MILQREETSISSALQALKPEMLDFAGASENADR
jgi:hypothetical protein